MKFRTAFVAALAVVTLVAATGCGHVMMMMHGKNVARPAATEFGTGPRVSASRLFTATLQSDRPLRPRRMQTVRVAITDAAGVPVDDATIQIDGGMPQHGHGLPTRPRVTRALGNGLYEIEGVRFNMGGWWEFKLAINAASASDVVTFNLAL
ncbi:MAG: FixH family protein [Vicinamibacterales bacterium]